MMDLFKITGCLTRSMNEAFGILSFCVRGFSTSHSNASFISPLVIFTPFTLHTLWMICMASSCLSLVSSQRTDSGMKLQHKITTNFRLVLKIKKKHMYYWQVVRCIQQSRRSNGQLKGSPISEDNSQCGR